MDNVVELEFGDDVDVLVVSLFAVVMVELAGGMTPVLLVRLILPIMVRGSCEFKFMLLIVDVVDVVVVVVVVTL